MSLQSDSTEIQRTISTSRVYMSVRQNKNNDVSRSYTRQRRRSLTDKRIVCPACGARVRHGPQPVVGRRCNPPRASRTRRPPNIPSRWMSCYTCKMPTDTNIRGRKYVKRNKKFNFRF